jgi:chemotaxis signal transduction protein/nucleoid-associated protein YgaU
LEISLGWDTLLLVITANSRSDAREAAVTDHGPAEMREALLFTFDDHQYGVWKEQVISVETVSAVHRLPFLKSSLTVLAVIGDHTRTLADLGSCLGHEQRRDRGKATALVMTEQGQVRGFLLNGDVSSSHVEPSSIVQLPEYLRIPYVECFISHDGHAIPVIAVRELFAEILKEGKLPRDAVPSIMSRPARDQGAGSVSPAPLRLIAAGQGLFVIRADEFVSKKAGALSVASFPLVPDDIDGIVINDNRLIPVVDVARRITNGRNGDKPTVLEAKLDGMTIGLLVDQDRGEWAHGELSVKDLPPVCRTPWSVSAGIHDGQTTPIVDLARLLARKTRAEVSSVAASYYKPSSSFPSAFGHQEVEVIEIAVQGRRYAIPEAEVKDNIPFTHAASIPGATGIVSGVAACDEELLPVVDLGLIQGKPSDSTAAWRMILVQNGNFRALVCAEKVFQRKVLKPAAQREVPVTLPYPVVYGCYTDGEAIRLILNIHALALYFDESKATQILPPLTPDETVKEAAPQPVADEELKPGLILSDVEEIPASEQEPVPIFTPPTALPAVPLSPPAPEEAAAIAESTQAAEPTPAKGETPIAPDVARSVWIPKSEAERGPPVEKPTAAAASAEEAEDEATPRIVDHSQWRIPLGFAASLLLIVALGAGLFFTDLARQPQQALRQTVQAATAAPAQPASAVAQQRSVVTEIRTESLMIYVVKEGDTLWEISQRLTGDPLNYRQIAGQNQIPNPDLIFPGQSLRTSSDSRASK